MPNLPFSTIIHKFIVTLSISRAIARSGVPNKTKIGKLSRAQLEKIATEKMPDLSASTLEAAINTVSGTARSMGVDVEK